MITVSAFNDEITLVRRVLSAERTENGFRVPGAADKGRTVFADAKSVGHTESYESLSAGVRAVMKFDMWGVEYDGENIVEFNDKQYRVIRTYVGRNQDVIELTVTDMGVGVDA